MRVLTGYRWRLCLKLSMFLFTYSCIQLHAQDFRANVTSNPIETFKANDDPYTVTVNNSIFSTPYGYDKAENAGRLYPLVVIGKWGEGDGYFNDDTRKRYPSFYLVFQYSSDSDGANLADIIDVALSEGLRIDVNRILYTGFSAGGSGSFKLVRGMASRGKYFAGLNRVAGQSESVLFESASGRTSIWLHIGLQDTAQRIAVSRKLYQNLKNHPINTNAIETYVSDTIKDVKDPNGNVPRNMWVLKKNGVEIARYSEYPTCGHDAWVGYADPYMFEWLFGRAISTKEGQKTHAILAVPDIGLEQTR